MDGKALGAKVREEVAASVAELGHVGLATVLVGDDPASHIYIDLKQKAAQEAGMDARDLKLPADTSEDDLLFAIAELNADDEVDGEAEGIGVIEPGVGGDDEAVVGEVLDHVGVRGRAPDDDDELRFHGPSAGITQIRFEGRWRIGHPLSPASPSSPLSASGYGRFVGGVVHVWFDVHHGGAAG